MTSEGLYAQCEFGSGVRFLVRIGDEQPTPHGDPRRQVAREGEHVAGKHHRLLVLNTRVDSGVVQPNPAAQPVVVDVKHVDGLHIARRQHERF